MKAQPLSFTPRGINPNTRTNTKETTEMPLDVQNLRTKKSDPVDVFKLLNHPDKSLWGELIVVYKLHGLGVNDTAEAGELMEDEDYAELGLADILSTINSVDSWNLLNGGEPVPLTVEGIREANVSRLIMKYIGEAMAKYIKLGEGKGSRKLRRL